MCFRRARGQKILSEKLARKGRGASGKRLLEGGNFAGHSARRIFLGRNGEKRLSIGAVEEIDEALFCCLRYSINFFSVALHGDEGGR